MKIAFVVHAVASCWNNGNAHFLRGLMTSLQALGHEVVAFEPAGAWSRENLVADAGESVLAEIAQTFPTLTPRLYVATEDAVEQLQAFAPDLVVVHEWNEPALVDAIGTLRKRGAPFVLMFHDTHHRAVSAPDELARFDLSGYDGVLAFGAVIAEIYARRGWGSRAYTFHEAADPRVFFPHEGEPDGDLVWIGNFGDDERSRELREYLLEPAAALGLKTLVHGVRYPPEALAALAEAGIRCGGYLPNHRAPAVFARHRVTMHVPRKQYAETLHGIPTIRVFEALACGIPLVSAPWSDAENLFPPGAYLSAGDGAEMRRHLADVLADDALRRSLIDTGLAAIAVRHTTDHRARELLDIHAGIAASAPERRTTA